MTVIAIPRILQERLTDEGADIFVEILDKVEDRAQKVTLEIAEERFEKKVFQLDGKIETTRAQLETKITQSETRLIRWMFIFWIGQFASIVGVLSAILFAFFRK